MHMEARGQAWVSSLDPLPTSFIGLELTNGPRQAGQRTLDPPVSISPEFSL